MNPSGSVVPPAFHRALSRFRNSLSDEEKNIFSHVTSEKEVWNLVEELQKEQGSRMALRNMRRVEPFINGMAQYASVIEVFVQVKPDIMALVWGPLKLLLELASRFVESFDRVLDAIERIGENLPRFRRFGEIFSYSDQIQQVIGLIYEDILDFYRRALKFFRRRAWKIVFSLTWDSFENRFGHILSNLQRHQSLVDNEARAEDIEQAHNARQEALKQFKAFQERDRNDRMMTMFNWLNPANIEVDKDKAASKKSPGKTVFSFSILEHLEMEKKTTDSSRPILYFFCGYSQAHRNTSLAILRTFIYQIVNQDNDLLPYVYREWLNDHHSHSSASKLKGLLCNLLEASVTASENVYIIIDGLDELSDTERQDFLHVLKPLRSKAPYNSIARIFVASRNLSDIRTGLSTPKVTEISIEGNNTDDIHKYIDCESQRVGERLGLESEMRELIAVSLRTRADGMFLWVHLIIESLLTQTTIKGIRETLGNLPKGLDQAYERILLRIKSLPPHAQDQANKILEWLTCGSRILKVSELEDAFAINPGDSTVDGDSRPFRDSFRFLCGPVIELTDQDTIVFVHFSAKEYLLSQYSGPFIHRLTAHLKISLVCITYQCFQCFEPALSNSMATKFVLNGNLRLFDYVQSSWLEHIEEFCRLCPDQSQLERLSVALRGLFGKQNSLLRPNLLFTQANRPNDQQTFSPESLARVQDFNCLEPGLKTELMKVLEYDEALKRKLSILGTRDELISWCDKCNPLTVDRGGRVLQQVLEDLLHGTLTEPPVPANVEKLRKLYGTNLYKCRYQFCRMSSGEDFATLAQRQCHEEKHVRPYRCQEQGCTYGDRGFTSKNHLRKHTKDYHTVSAISKCSAGAIEDLRQSLINRMEDENQSIFSLINLKSVDEKGSDSVVNSGNSIVEDLSLESFELTNQLLEKTELLDRILASRAPPLFSSPNKSTSLMMGKIQAIIDSCVDRFLDTGLITNLKGAEILQIEIVLRQLSGQLKSWKKLVQSFHIVSQSSRATEQLVFNILHCREQYSDEFETPKGRYTTTVLVLEKTRDRLAQCYSYIQNTTRDQGEQASLLDNISNQRTQASQKPQQEIPQQLQQVPQPPQIPDVPREVTIQQNNQPGILQQPGIGHPQAIGQNQNMSLSPPKATLQALGQPPHPFLPSPQPSGHMYKDAAQGGSRELLRQSGIDPTLLTPGELMVFQSKDLDAQRELIGRFSRALRLLVKSRIDPSLLIPQEFTMFRSQDSTYQSMYIELYHQFLVDKTADSIFEHLEENRIDPALLTTTELMSFQPRGLDAERKSVRGSSHAGRLLIANGVNPNQLTPQEFAAFGSLNPVNQIRSFRMHHQAYTPRTPVVIPKVPTEEGINSDRLAPQQSTTLPSQDSWGPPKSKHSAPLLPEPLARSTSYNTGSCDTTLSLSKINPSRLEPPNERFSLPDNLYGHTADLASEGSHYNILEDICTLTDSPEPTESGKDFEIQYGNPGAPRMLPNLQNFLGRPSSWKRSGPKYVENPREQDQRDSEKAKVQSEQFSPPYQRTTHPMPSAAQGFPEAMLEVDGPEDDPFYGLEDEIFGPRN